MTQGHPAWTKRSAHGPTQALGSGSRARESPGREAAGRAARGAEFPNPTPAQRVPSWSALPAPPASKSASRRAHPGTDTHRTSVGSDRPSSPGCQCPPHQQCGGSGSSPWCAAGRAGAGVGRGQQQRRPHADMARTRPHGRLPTAAEAWPPSPHPRLGPGARHHNGPPASGTKARRKM